MSIEIGTYCGVGLKPEVVEVHGGDKQCMVVRVELGWLLWNSGKSPGV